MSVRARLVILLLALHLATSLAVGSLAWWWLDREVAISRQERAAAIAAVLAEGGFTLDARIQGRMETLAGTAFRVVDGTPPAPGTVRASAHGRTVEVQAPASDWERAGAASLVALAVFLIGGTALFAAAAWWGSALVTRPLERLGAAAAGIGQGRLDQPVPAIGTGEVAALASTLEAMRRRLADLERQAREQERLVVLGSFAAVIAHEVRNPLSAIRLTIQGMHRNGREDELTLVEEEIERLDLVVDGLLGYSRGMQVRCEPLHLAEVVDATLRLLRRQADHHGVTLARQGDAEVTADPHRLRQVLLNLVLNAIQAQPGGGEVLVRIGSDGFAVEDRGAGMPAPAPTGDGLGLRVAASIIAAHGGSLAHLPRPGGGTRAVVGGISAVPPRS